jgi:hypothetical protein
MSTQKHGLTIPDAPMSAPPIMEGIGEKLRRSKELSDIHGILFDSVLMIAQMRRWDLCFTRDFFERAFYTLSKSH